MNRIIVITIIISLLNLKSYSQPGEYGGNLLFRVYFNGEIIKPNNRNFNIYVGDTLSKTNNLKYNKETGHYCFESFQTQLGGIVPSDFSIKIVHKTDTMTVVPPNFGESDIKLDSIPFIKGYFKIPMHIYNLKSYGIENIKDYIPNLYEDWNLLRSEQKVILVLEETVAPPEKQEEYLNLYFKNYTKPQKITYADNNSYYSHDLLFIKEGEEQFSIYKITEAVEQTIVKSNIYQFRTDTIFFENGFYYAIGFRVFGFCDTHKIYGKFRLVFEKNFTKQDKLFYEHKYHKDLLQFVDTEFNCGGNTDLMVDHYKKKFMEFEQENNLKK